MIYNLIEPEQPFLMTMGAAFGVVNHFIVMLPENPALPRRENFGYMVDR